MMRWSPAENSDQWSLRVPIWSSDPPVKWPEIKSMCALQQSGGHQWPPVANSHGSVPILLFMIMLLIDVQLSPLSILSIHWLSAIILSIISMQLRHYQVPIRP